MWSVSLQFRFVELNSTRKRRLGDERHYLVMKFKPKCPCSQLLCSCSGSGDWQAAHSRASQTLKHGFARWAFLVGMRGFCLVPRPLLETWSGIPSAFWGQWGGRSGGGATLFSLLTNSISDCLKHQLQVRISAHLGSCRGVGWGWSEVGSANTSNRGFCLPEAYRWTWESESHTTNNNLKQCNITAGGGTEKSGHKRREVCAVSGEGAGFLPDG